MKGDKLRASILGIRLISNLSSDLAKGMGIDSKYKCIGIITADSDDVLYTALDEATKASEVDVLYAKSFYGGASNASTKLAGEVVGILGGTSPAEVRSGIGAVEQYFKEGDCFISANNDDSINYYAHTVSRTGTYLSKVAGVLEGEALAYLIAPPLEAIYGVDEALKSADVKLAVMFAPPSETNYGGALLTGTQSACSAACMAFAQAVENVAEVNRYYE